MKFQTEGFVPLGDMSNDEHYPCLMCKQVPERVWVDLFTPEKGDISFPVPDARQLAVTYRLCPQCAKNPDQWKIRLLILERLNGAQ